MADKQPEKLKMKRKRSKVNSKVMNEISLEDVVRAGGDEVSALSFCIKWFACRNVKYHACGRYNVLAASAYKVNMFIKLRPNLSL